MAMKQCLRRGGVALDKTRRALQQRWKTLDVVTRNEISRALVYAEANLQRGLCRAAAQHLGFARQVLKRGSVRSRAFATRQRRTG